MVYDDRKRLNGLQELRPLSIPHREEPVEVVEEEEIVEVEELPPIPLSPLIIEFFPSEFETVTNGEITITAVAIDPDGDNSTLDFEFIAEAGEFSDQTSDINDMGQAVETVTWTAPPTIPDEPTEYKIDVVVTDEEGLTGFTGDDPLAQRPSLVIIVRFHCRPPDRPEAPIISVEDDTSLNVRWIAPADNGCDIEDYDLRYRIRVEQGDDPNDWVEHDAGMDNDEWLPVSDNIDGFEITLTGLTDPQDHEVQVRAVNEAGEGEWSPSGYLMYTNPTVMVVADPDVIALSGSNNLPNTSTITATVSDTVDEVDDLTVTFTVFLIAPDGSRTEGAIFGIEVSGTGLIRTFMHPGTNGEYDIDVTVENRGGLSTTETVRIRAIAVPDAPNIPNVTYIDGDSIDVRWDEPDKNFSDISDYDLRYKLISDVADRYQEWMPDTMDEMNAFLSRQAIITGLGTNAANYQVQVRATNEAGEGAWGLPGSANGPPVITAFTGQVVGDTSSMPVTGSVTINKDQEVSLVVTAEDTDSPPDPLTYDFQVIQVDGADKDDDDTNVGSFRDTPLDNIRIFTPPSNRRPVTLTVQAEVSDGLPEDGGLSDTATIDVIVENRLPTVSVVAAQTEIHTNGGTDVDGTVTELDGDTVAYLWTVADVNDDTNTDNGTFSTTTEVKTRYNAPDREGTFRLTLTATETLPDGTTMNSVSAFVDIVVTIQVFVPDPPTLLSLEIESDTELEVTWEAPENDGGADITEYQIEYRVLGSLTTQTQTYTVTDSTPDPIVDTLTGLMADTSAYQVRVRAMNSVGFGNYSNILVSLNVTLTADNTTINKGAIASIGATASLSGVTYSWSVSPNRGSLSTTGNSATTAWTAPYISSLFQSERNNTSDAYTITCTVTRTDPNTGSVQTASGTILITVVNRAPTILSFVASGLTLGSDIPVLPPGNNVIFTAQIVDADAQGDSPPEQVEIDWAHSAGSGVESDEDYDDGIFRSVFTWTLPNTPGTYDLTMTASDTDYVTDSNGNVVNAVVTRTVQIRVNTPPTISITGPTTAVDANTAHLLTITINDADNDGTDDEINEEHISFITNEGGGSYLGIASVANQSELDEAVMQNPVRIVKVTTAFSTWSVNDVLHYDGSDWSRIGTSDPTDNTPPTLVRVSEGNYLRHWQAPDKKGTAVVEVQYQDYHRATLVSTVNAQASITVNNQSPQLRILPEDATITTVQELILTASPLDGESQIDPDGDDVTFVWEIEGIGQLQFGDETIEEGETISTGTNPQVTYIPPSPPDAPEAPTVEVVPTDGTQLMLSWTAPDDNGSEIIDYDLRYKLSTQDDMFYIGVDIDLTDVTITDSTISYTVAGLRSSHSYDFQVRAENIAGNSDWSPIGTGSTPSDPPTIDSFTTLDDDIEINGTTIVNVVASDADDDDLYYEYSIVSDPGDGTYGTIVADPDNEDRATYTAPGEAGIFDVQVQVFDTPADMRDPDVTYPTETLTITVIDRPDAPDAPTVTALANDTTISIPRSQIRVTWTEPDDNNSPIKRYEVQYREDGSSIYNSVPLADDFTDIEVTITNLKPNTTYHVQVRARNSASISLGISDWSPDGSGVTNDDVPDRPDRPVITVPDGETMHLRVDWTAPNANGEDITDYDIRYRKSPETSFAEWEASTISTDTFTTITGLEENTLYQIQVRATNSVGDSEWSESGSGVTDRTNVVPVISSFNATATVLTVFEHPTLPETAILTVTATDDFTPVLDLTYTFSVPSGHGTIVHNADIPFMATYTPPSTPGVYTITVEVSDGDADLDQPSETIEITAINVPDKPAAPTVTADPNDSTKLIVRWTEPNFNFSSIIDYDVRYKKTTQPDTSYEEWNADATNYLNIFATIEDLDGNTQYDVQVRASNIAGVSDWSDVTTQSTRNTSPVISSFISTPESVVVQGSSTLIVTASDEENDQLTFTFSLPHETMDDDHGTLTAIMGETERYMYTAPNVTGTYTVRVVVSDGSFSVSRDLSIVVTDGRPPPPAAPTVNTHSAGSILVRWSPPPTYQGPPVTHYNLRYKLSTASSYTIFADMDGDAIDISGQFQIISGLSNDTDYDVQVRAVNSAGASGWSDAGTGTTGAAGVVTPPQPPVISSVTSPIHHTLTVTWIKPPIDDDPDTDDDITSYDVQYKLASDTDYNDVTLADDFTDLTIDITGLTANTEYDVRVQASNSAGASGYSDPTRAQTAVQIQPPSPPENVVVSENPDPTMLNVRWDVPNLFGGTLVDYDVQYREAVDEGETENAWQNWPATDTTDTNPSTTIEGLTADTSYDVRVRSQNNSTIDNGNGVGTSAWTTPVEGKTAEMRTLARVPDAPSITSPLPPSPGQDAASDQPTSITLSWSEPNDNGSEITGYYVQYKLVTNNTWIDLTRTADKLLERTATISNLTPNTRYNVRVLARNDVGDSPYSSESTIRTAAFVAPPAPAVTVGTITTSSIMVSWTAPSTTHTIIGYRVQWKLFTEPDSSYRLWTRRMSGLSETVSNLSDNTRYNIRIAAVVGDSTTTVIGAWGTVDATTLRINRAPQILEFFASPTQITTNQRSTVTANASDADSDPLSYDVEITHFNGTDITNSMTDYGSITQLTDDSSGRKRFRFTPPDRSGVYRYLSTHTYRRRWHWSN